MSTNGDLQSQTSFDLNDHQTSYVFTPVPTGDEPIRPQKRRKISNGKTEEIAFSSISQVQFMPLLNGAESSTCVEARQRLFRGAWATTESRVQSILDVANEDTLDELCSFVDDDLGGESRDQIPTALIVTGPNTASQELLFSQISYRLKSRTNNLVITLRSMDASNLKTALKKLIRVAANVKGNDDDEEQVNGSQNGRKLLNYDLQILQDHLVSSSYSKVVVAFQDSEAFSNSVLAELLLLLRSWLDRIPFVVLFGIATSVELFHERLHAGAIRCLRGTEFNVEKTSETIDKVFEKVIVGSDTPLRLGATFVSSVLERQHDHVQSMQTFVGALKYAYMSHFYANPLSILQGYFYVGAEEPPPLQKEHFEAVRTLPSFRRKIDNLLREHEVSRARLLLESNDALLETIQNQLCESYEAVVRLLAATKLLATVFGWFSATKGKNLDPKDLYVKAFAGQLVDSSVVKDTIASIQILTPDEIVSLTMELICLCTDAADRSLLLQPSDCFLESLNTIQAETQELQQDAKATGASLRSKYVAQSKNVRTTVVAQKVQLSSETSTLSILDISFTELVDQLSGILEEHLAFQDLQNSFLHEIWLYDLKSPNRETFTPRPRHAIERALSNPNDYLSCTCCKASEEGLSSSQPPTAILYQLYIETGGLINVHDLWSAFYTVLGGDERTGLALFYRGLSDLKLLGMIKQSRKKTDHLAKLAWKGL